MNSRNYQGTDWASLILTDNQSSCPQFLFRWCYGSIIFVSETTKRIKLLVWIHHLLGSKRWFVLEFNFRLYDSGREICHLKLSKFSCRINRDATARPRKDAGIKGFIRVIFLLLIISMALQFIRLPLKINGDVMKVLISPDRGTYQIWQFQSPRKSSRLFEVCVFFLILHID